MKIGQKVSFVDAKGDRHPATVTDIAGTGASGFKTLDLSYGDTEVKAVAHAGDQEEGEGFWLLHGERRPNEDEEKEEVKPAPVARRRGKQ
jgi:hypothetical protein